MKQGPSNDWVPEQYLVLAGSGTEAFMEDSI